MDNITKIIKASFSSLGTQNDRRLIIDSLKNNTPLQNLLFFIFPKGEGDSLFSSPLNLSNTVNAHSETIIDFISGQVPLSKLLEDLRLDKSVMTNLFKNNVCSEARRERGEDEFYLSSSTAQQFSKLDCFGFFQSQDEKRTVLTQLLNQITAQSYKPNFSNQNFQGCIQWK